MAYFDGPRRSRKGSRTALALVVATVLVVLIAGARGESGAPEGACEGACGAARGSGASGGSGVEQAAGEPRATIEIVSPCEVSKPIIRLGDIALLGGLEDGDLARLAELEMGNAPLPGQERTLSLAIVRVRLRQAGFDPGQMRISSPTTILVRSKAAPASQDDMVAAVRDFVRARMPWDERDAEIRVLLSPGEILVPVGAVSYEVEALPTTRFIGTTSVRLTVLVDGQPCKTLMVRTRIDVARGVVVAARPIGRHEEILESYLRVEVRDLTTVPADVALWPSQVVGMRATHTIQVGRPVALSAVEPEPVVQRGDPVVIQALMGGVVVTSSGEALEDGCEGARIRVRNKASGAIVRATVVGPDTVRAAW